MQKAVIYTRVSTGQQVEEGTSLEVQEAACLRKAQELSAEVVDIISDEGVSGAFYMSRPGIQQALKMLEAGQANLLVTMKLDRTGRDVDIVRLIQKRVTNAGGRLIFADGMNFENNATGRLMLTQLAGFAEFERDLIRERTVGGKRRRAEDGVQTARTLSPFGYHIVTKEDVLTGVYPVGTVGTYQIVEHEAEIVREIFRLYSSGFSLRQICHLFQKRNIPTPRGGKYWIHTTVRLILSNPVHKGMPFYGRYRSQADEKRIEQGKKARYRKGTNPSEWIPLAAPALVSEEIWNQCQERLQESQARRSGNPERVHALAGLLKCPKCGKRLLGNRRRYQNKNGTVYEDRFFQCQHSRPSQNAAGLVCDNSRFNARQAEQLARKAINFLVRYPEVLAAALRVFQRRQATSDVTKQMEAASKELQAIEKQEKATVEAQIAGLMAGTSAAPYIAVLRELAEKRERIQNHLLELQARQEQARENDPTKTADMLHQVAAIVEELLTTEEVSEARKREIYSSIIEEIGIIPDEAGGTWGVDILLRSNYPQVSESALPPGLHRLRYTGVNISIK